MDNDNKVFIIRCHTYEDVEDKLTELLGMMNGMGTFAKSGEKIVLKINLLQSVKPEKAVTTHPSVVAAVARLVKKEGAIPIIADSPGSGYVYNKKTLNKTYRRCGIDRVADEEKIEINFDPTHKIVSFPEGKLIKRFEVITPVLESDGVINLCKLKTHLFMHMTGAVKNNFGVIPGLTKPGYHAKLSNKSCFASMLLDLAEYVSPRISIMDAVTGLEGDGPGAAGLPRPVGLLIAARNPLALDVVAGEIIGLNRENNPVLMEAAKRDLYPNSIEDVQIIGADISDISIHDFKFPPTILKGTALGVVSWWQKALVPLVKTGMSLKPLVVREKCTACGACTKACPIKAVTVMSGKGNYAQIDDKKCIRCYCCHEMCQESAIKLHKSLLYRVVNR